jgi:hypothetical protein
MARHTRWKPRSEGSPNTVGDCLSSLGCPGLSSMGASPRWSALECVYHLLARLVACPWPDSLHDAPCRLTSGIRVGKSFYRLSRDSLGHDLKSRLSGNVWKKRGSRVTSKTPTPGWPLLDFLHMDSCITQLAQPNKSQCFVVRTSLCE